MRKKNIIILISGFILLRLFLLGLPPLTDPSETRYATIAKEMALSGDYFAPQIWIDGRLTPFMGKPPLGFWMMAISIKILGENEFAVRLPSLLCSFLLLGIIFFIMKRYSEDYSAWVAVLVTATSTSFFLLSGVVLVDMILSLFSMGAIFFYYAYLSEKQYCLKKIWSLFIFMFLGFAFIIKGPVGLVYFGIPVFLWTIFSGRYNSLKEHAWISGSVLFLVITVPCFLLMEKAMPGVLKYFFIHENFLRYTTADYGDLYSNTKHGLPWGVAIPLTIVVCLPWVFFPLYQISKKSLRFFNRNNYKEKCNSRQLTPRDKIVRIHEYFSSPETIFPLGIISLALFWSCSSQVMLYYLIVMVPLFGAWCGIHFRRESIPLQRIAAISIILTLLYLFAHIPLVIFLDQYKSSRAILKEAIALSGTEKQNVPIIFIRRDPYSAYFYAGDSVRPHGKENVEASVRRGINDKRTVYIMLKKYFARIPEELRCKLEVRIYCRRWIVATILKEE